MTFERQFMAAACLAVVWVNTALILGHGASDLLRLSRLRRRLFGRVGTFTADSAEGGASYRLVQAGRTRGDGSIHFHDRQVECALLGPGHAETLAGRFEVEVDEGGAWVWPTSGQLALATRCASQEDFDGLAGPALHARGAERVALVRLGAESKVAGGVVRDGVLRGERSQPLVFSSDDPRGRLLRLELRVVSVLVAILLVAALLTGLCFVGPAFGLVSQVAAFGLFVYFLLVQPVGVWLSESVRFPHEVYRGGSWRRRAVQPGETPSASAQPRSAPADGQPLERSAASN